MSDSGGVAGVGRGMPGAPPATPPGPVAVIGQGYVGLPLAVLASESGFDVIGVDADAEKVRTLAGGRSPIEDVSDERLRAALASGRYMPTGDVSKAAGFGHAVISVPTPLRDRQPDLAFVEEAVASLAPHLTRGATVILESTSYPGTTEEIVRPLLEGGSGLEAGRDFFLGYSPERIDPGNETWPLAKIPKIVSGIDDGSLAAVAAFFDRLGIQTVAAKGTREAEMAKLLENTFRHVNIALVNELAMFAHELGIDVWDAIDMAATKPFGFMRFTPGPGVGGHCLPIDPSYLSWRVERHLGHTFRFVELANDVNEHMPEYVVRRVAAGLNRRSLAVRDRHVILLGLAYKRGAADTREAPAYRIADLLLREGARVSAVDPLVSAEATPPGIARLEGTRDELLGADAIVLLVDQPGLDLGVLDDVPGFVLDCRGVLPSGSIERL
jgi:UDP-N-acetyl-D-glucosamine dehydrogenase